VREHFADKEPEYFFKGIELLVHRFEKYVQIKGDYLLYNPTHALFTL
jgi:hypothetical protein